MVFPPGFPIVFPWLSLGFPRHCPAAQAAALKAALQAAQRAQNVEAAQDAQQRLREAVAKAKAEGKVNDQEAVGMGYLLVITHPTKNDDFPQLC